MIHTIGMFVMTYSPPMFLIVRMIASTPENTTG